MRLCAPNLINTSTKQRRAALGSCGKPARPHSLNHPHIGTVHEVVEAVGMAFVVMEPQASAASLSACN